MPNFTDNHEIEFPQESGKFYRFDPYRFGTGFWIELPGNKTAPAYIQKRINEYFFGMEELPHLYERFSKASFEEKQKLKNISTGWMQLKIKALKEGIAFPNANYGRPLIFTPGGLYIFVYGAKHKDTLPIWDKLPLPVILDINSNKNINEPHFLGLNLHFLKPNERMALLSDMEANSVHDKSKNHLKTTLTYDQLKSSSFFKRNNNCIKYYLMSHIKGKILAIEPHEWVFASQFTFGEFAYNKRK